MMKYIFLIVCMTLSAALSCAGQGVVSGTVRDAESGEPLGYATIGVVGTSVGCVADRDGRFEIAVPDTMPGSEQLRISLISYEPVVISVADFLALGTYDFRLVPKPALLKELVVKPAKVKRRTFGYDYSKTGIYAYVGPEERGYEMGVLFNIKKRSVLETVTLNIGRSTYEFMTFRINIYRKTGDGQFENILSKPIYGHCPKTKQSVYIDIGVYDHDIVLEGDILVAFEHIEDSDTGEITFPTGFLGAKSYVRVAGEDKWEYCYSKSFKVYPRVPITITVLETK